MKILWKHDLYYLIENHAAGVELEPVAGSKGRHVFVAYDDPDLIIDPTDGDIDEAEQARATKETP